MARGHFNLEKTRRPIPFSNFAERYREFASGYKREWYEEKYIVEEFAKIVRRYSLGADHYLADREVEIRQSKNGTAGDSQPMPLRS
jgi:hypothetical protein